MQDLAGVTKYFLENEEARNRHAVAGAEYVRTEYSWSSVLRRFDTVVEELIGAIPATCSEGSLHE
jgi:glycosyltransferase involved in cell wall biosynthesis